MVDHLSLAPSSSPLSWILSILLPAAGLFLAKRVLSYRSRKQYDYPLPPGPKPKPIIGNLLDLPVHQQWLRVTDWAKEFGDIVHVNVAGSHIIFVNQQSTAVEVLDKRTAISSGRPVSSMVDLMGVERIFAFMRYGSNWRIRRRIFHQGLNAAMVHKYTDTQLKYTRDLLVKLKNNPNDFSDHIRHFTSSAVLDLTYGFDINPINDPLVDIADAGGHFVEGMVTGAYLVDAFPFLKSLPNWFPDPGFIGTRAAKRHGKALRDFVEIPFKSCCLALKSGTARPSLVDSWLRSFHDSLPEGKEREDMSVAIKDAAAAVFSGGSETTMGTMLNFVLLMVLYPEAQHKAQAELDRVVGRGRTPDLSDRANLPYVNALLTEVLRWFPVNPLGVPHKLTTDCDEIYRGMRFPKGSIILANLWAMSRNVKEYGDDAEAFRPERFMSPGANPMDPRAYTFGFGRRICPGRHLVENSLYISSSHMLHLFSFDKAVKDDGSEIPTNHHWVSGLMARLDPFPCSIKLRFEGAEGLLNPH